MGQLRVLYVNDLAFIVDSLSRSLLERGIEPRVIGRAISGPPSMSTTFLRNVSAIQKSLVCANDFDILHINYGLFGFVAFETEVPKILHCHGSDIRPGRNLKSRVANLVTRSSIPAVDRVWYANTDLLPYFEGVEVPHRYMPNPVAADFFESPGPQSEPARVLFAIPLTYLKGADIAVEAMRILTGRALPAEIATFSYPVLRTESDHLSERIPREVIRLPWTPHREMPRLLRRASVVVGRLRLGSLGITELETMACGRPLIVQQRGSVKGLDGYYASDPPVISCSTALEVADAVQQCLTDDSFAREVGNKSRRWAEEYHSPSVVADLYATEYRQLANT